MKNKKGFTLIEVVVVTLIIAALALLVAPSFKNSTVTNDIEKAKMGLVEYTNAVKLYNEVHPNVIMTGTFNSSQYAALTTNDDNDLVYLQNAGTRWTPGTGTYYTFLGLDCTYRYVGGDVVSMAKCKFPKYNEEDGKDCYWFTINKNQPLVIKREIKEEETCEVH